MAFHRWAFHNGMLTIIGIGRIKAGCPSADYIIVDEAQDFSKEDIELFRSKARKALLLYGDSPTTLYFY